MRISVLCFLCLAFFRLSFGIVFIEAGLNTGVPVGEIEPSDETSGYGELYLALGPRIGRLSAGICATYVMIGPSYAIVMDDGYTYDFGQTAGCGGLYLGFDRGIFYANIRPSIGRFALQGEYDFLDWRTRAEVDEPMGIVVPCAIGLQFKGFRVGVSATYCNWSSPVDVYYEDFDVLWWDTEATGSADCRFSGALVGMNLSFHLKL